MLLRCLLCGLLLSGLLLTGLFRSPLLCSLLLSRLLLTGLLLLLRCLLLLLSGRLRGSRSRLSSWRPVLLLRRLLLGLLLASLFCRRLLLRCLLLSLLLTSFLRRCLLLRSLLLSGLLLTGLISLLLLLRCLLRRSRLSSWRPMLLLRCLLLSLLLGGLLLTGLISLLLLLRGLLRRSRLSSWRPVLLLRCLLRRLLLGLLLASLLRRLLLCGLLLGLLLTSFLGCLLLGRLLLSSLLLLGRRRPIAANWWLIVRCVGNGRVPRLIRWLVWWRSVGRRLCVPNRRLIGRMACIQCCGFSRRRLLHHRMRCCNGRRAQRLHLMRSQRLAGVLCQLLLLFGKGNRRRRRRCLRHHWTIDYRRRRLGHPSGTRIGSSKNAFSRWSYRSSGYHGRRGYLFLVHLNGGSRYRCRASKRVLRNCGHCAGHSPVHVGHVGDVGIVRDLVVIDIGDGRRVHPGVAGIDAFHVPTTRGISGYIDFAGTQWEPAHITAASAGRNGHAKIRSADKGDECWRVHRLNVNRTGNPSPSTAERDPAAVMEWCVTPGGVIYPGPAPGRDPHPVAVAVRSPSGLHRRRRPNIAIGWIGVPCAVGIQIFIAHDVRGDVSRRPRSVVLAVAGRAPIVEIVGIAHGDKLSVEIVGTSAGKRSALSLVQVVAAAATGYLSVTLPHNRHRRVSVTSDLKAILARLGHSKCLIGGIDLEDFAVVQAPYTEIKRSVCQLDLYGTVVEIKEGESGVLVHANHCRTDLDLGA